VTFFRTRCGIFNRDVVEIKNASSVLRLKMSEDAEFVSSEIEESAALAVNELLPVKSRKKYDKAYQQFEDWCREKRVRHITEEVLLAYFEQKSRKLKGSTLWR
jgi:hypothetical protein